MKIRDVNKTYTKCKICPDIEMKPDHVFSYPTIVAAIQWISDCPQGGLHMENCLLIVEAVWTAHGII